MARQFLQVATRYSSCNIVSILIEDELTTTIEEVMKVVAGNWKSGKEVMKLLLKQREVDMESTEKMIKIIRRQYT
jgi:predicted transcriptional regulator